MEVSFCVGTMDEEEEEEHNHLRSISLSSSSLSEDGSSSNSSNDYLSSELMEDATSTNGPLFEMSSLVSQLPFKRGLSRHYEGKSRSFTCLSNVKCLEDLVKPERQVKKRQKLKTSRSCSGNLDTQKTLSLSRSIAKKGSKTSTFFSVSSSSSPKGKRNISRPPIPPTAPQRNNNLCGQALLFA